MISLGCRIRVSGVCQFGRLAKISSSKALESRYLSSSDTLARGPMLVGGLGARNGPYRTIMLF